MIANNLIERIIPDKPNHPTQKFQLTERGQLFLGLLAK
ncbi:Fic family protein [uncultured Odoribacter sp.]